VALPDFTLPVTIDGHPSLVLCRDVPAHVFFADFAASFPSAPCFERAHEEEQARVMKTLSAWCVHLLPRVVVYPVLTVADVLRMGPAWDELSLAYLCAVNFVEDPKEHDRVPAPSLPGVDAPIPAPHAFAQAALSTYAITPEANLRAVLRMLAIKTKLPPSVLWALPISEWVFNYRVLLQADLLGKLARAAGSDAPEDLADAGIADA